MFLFQSRRYDSRTTIFSPEGRIYNYCIGDVLHICTSIYHNDECAHVPTSLHADDFKSRILVCVPSMFSVMVHKAATIVKM